MALKLNFLFTPFMSVLKYTDIQRYHLLLQTSVCLVNKLETLLV